MAYRLSRAKPLAEYMMLHCCIVTPYGDIGLGNTGLGNGLLPDGIKPLPEPMLHIITELLWYSPESNFTQSVQATMLYKDFENYVLKISATGTIFVEISVKILAFSFQKYTLKCRLQNDSHLVDASMCGCVCHLWWWWSGQTVTPTWSLNCMFNSIIHIHFSLFKLRPIVCIHDFVSALEALINVKFCLLWRMKLCK